MEHSESLSDLLGEVISNIDVLQKAIAEVGQVKTCLKTTASDLKSQIRDSISRHLEALRNRETWLLGQVEVVQYIKEDVLRQQHAELNKALGRLQSTSVLLQQSSEVLDTESLECRVRESLVAVGGLSFIPEETNKINFIAQNFELQEFIHRFGVVVSDNPIVDKQMVSSFQMVKFGKESAFFTPSGPCEEWLIRSGKSTSQSIPKIPSVECNIHDWLPQKAVQAVSTPESLVPSPQQPTEHWLSKGQSQKSAADKENGLEAPENERHDSDKDAAMLKEKSVGNQGWLLDYSRTSASPAMPSDLFDYYRVLKMSKSSQWLKKSGNTGEELSTTLNGETYHKITGLSGDDEWLKKKIPTGSSKFSRCTSTHSCSDCSGGLATACSDSHAQETSSEFDSTLSEMSDWIAVSNEDVEICSGIVASSDHMSGGVPNNDGWLLKQCHQTNVTGQDYTGIKNYKENLAAQSNQHWLLPCSENVSDEREAKELASSGMKSYIESLPVDFNHWLSNPSTDNDICKWLACSSSERCKNCPIMCSKGVFKVFDQIASSSDGWLMSQELY